MMGMKLRHSISEWIPMAVVWQVKSCPDEPNAATVRYPYCCRSKPLFKPFGDRVIIDRERGVFAHVPESLISAPAAFPSIGYGAPSGTILGR